MSIVTTMNVDSKTNTFYDYRCGYGTVHDVNTKELEDRMESFFLSETCKYLYLVCCNVALLIFSALFCAFLNIRSSKRILTFSSISRASLVCRFSPGSFVCHFTGICSILSCLFIKTPKLSKYSS